MYFVLLSIYSEKKRITKYNTTEVKSKWKSTIRLKRTKKWFVRFFHYTDKNGIKSNSSFLIVHTSLFAAP